MTSDPVLIQSGVRKDAIEKVIETRKELRSFKIEVVVEKVYEKQVEETVVFTKETKKVQITVMINKETKETTEISFIEEEIPEEEVAKPAVIIPVCNEQIIS